MDPKDKLKFSYVNIQSVRNKTFDIRDMLRDNHIDILALTETWLRENETSVVEECTPLTHCFLHYPREGRAGGGVGIFLSKSLTHRKMEKRAQLESFEYIHVKFKNANDWIAVVVIYRPPDNSRRALDVFFREFEALVSDLDLDRYRTIICGDFNLWMDREDLPDTNKMNDLLATYALENKVKSATANSGHTLDLVICDGQTESLANIKVDEVSTISPFHRMINCFIARSRCKYKKKILFRDKRGFDPGTFIETITEIIDGKLDECCSHMNQTLKRNCEDCYLELVNTTLRTEFDRTCPEREKEIIMVDNAPWFDGRIAREKRAKRNAERIWRELKTDVARQEFCRIKHNYNHLIRRKKSEYYKTRIESAGTYMKKIYNVLNRLTGKEGKYPRLS